MILWVSTVCKAHLICIHLLVYTDSRTSSSRLQPQTASVSNTADGHQPCSSVLSDIGSTSKPQLPPESQTPALPKEKRHRTVDPTAASHRQKRQKFMKVARDIFHPIHAEIQKFREFCCDPDSFQFEETRFLEGATFEKHIERVDGLFTYLHRTCNKDVASFSLSDFDNHQTLHDWFQHMHIVLGHQYGTLACYASTVALVVTFVHRHDATGSQAAQIARHKATFYQHRSRIEKLLKQQSLQKH